MNIKTVPLNERGRTSVRAGRAARPAKQVEAAHGEGGDDKVTVGFWPED